VSPSTWRRWFAGVSLLSAIAFAFEPSVAISRRNYCSYIGCTRGSHSPCRPMDCHCWRSHFRRRCTEFAVGGNIHSRWLVGDTDGCTSRWRAKLWFVGSCTIHRRWVLCVVSHCCFVCSGRRGATPCAGCTRKLGVTWRISRCGWTSACRSR
jgi:hypothetical protein